MLEYGLHLALCSSINPVYPPVGGFMSAVGSGTGWTPAAASTGITTVTRTAPETGKVMGNPFSAA